MLLNCIIVDDEPRAHNVLRHYIGKLPDLHFAASCSHVMEAYYYLKSNSADIIFLDINMPELNGFSLLELTGTKAAVIITTAYTDYAFKSYEYNAIDYLHKPIPFERFVTAIEKANRYIHYSAPARDAGYLEIKIDGALKQIPANDIIYIESLGNYVKIHCINGAYLVLITTRELQDKLPENSFVRIQKSYIINLAYVRALEQNHACLAHCKIPIGKTYKIYVEEQLRKYRLNYKLSFQV